MADTSISIRPALTKEDRRAFVDLPFRLYADDPNWVPPLKNDIHSLLTPSKNPWFEHGDAQLFLAERDGRVTGRITAHIDQLALKQPPEQGMGPGVGFWGFYEAEDEGTGRALIAAAEGWLREKGMTRAMGPFSFSYWDEIGLMVEGFDIPPTALMAFNARAYQGWIEGAGYAGVQDLYTYGLQIDQGFTKLCNRIVAMGERNASIRLRKVNKSRFAEEAALIIGILNDAWSDNWGFVPFTPAEIAYAGKKLKPIVFEDLIRVAEVDGEPVAFMMTIPDLNEKIAGFGGSLFPFNWAKLLWWLRKPMVKTMRVPLMGVLKKLQSTPLAGQLAMMMIEHIRRDAVADYGSTRGDFGWVLASNDRMIAVGESIGGTVNRVYRVYERTL